ncbi:MAG TPA: hypothetical protein VMT51_14795 [Dongiaceae bacterium]|nr:hypothetical protein [Dongiaceae bacterium]
MSFAKWVRPLVATAALGTAFGMVVATPPVASAQVAVSISVGYAPPPLPVYEQPICPGDGYIWTPGYWAWDGDDYFWVPGTWVEAPQPGYLWTPPYWGWSGAAFFFHEGYWGPRVGFYGGIDYGFGYGGHGYDGGRWENNRFYYNRAVNNVNVTVVKNVYETRVINNVNVTRVSYNGGNGGVNARPSGAEEAAARERHIGAVRAQEQHLQQARNDRALRASQNQGRPPIAATERPAAFQGGAVAAREGHYTPPPNRANGNGAPRNDERTNAEANAARNANGNRPYVHPSDLPPVNRPDRPNTGNPKLDEKYQKQQDKMYQKQQQDHEKLQAKQEREHQQAVQKHQNDAQKAQMEQRHQQQTQQMEQKHLQQQQRLEQKQSPRPAPQPRPSGGQPGGQSKRP